MRRLLTAILSVLLVALNILPIAAANVKESGIVAQDNYDGTVYEAMEDSDYTKPIPLLVIIISFDANNNGVSDYDPDNPTQLHSDKTSPLYGEQWSYSLDSEWYNRLFADTGSLKAFYEEATEGHFWFYPATESYADPSKGGVENDGIVQVVVPYKHPYAKTGNQGSEDSASRNAALSEASKYVDFASYDTDKNGYLSYTELAVVYVCAGGEYSAAKADGINNRSYFSVHAHYTSDYTGYNVDGVRVGRGGFVRVGEYQALDDNREGIILAVGCMAHELGHFLGAPDLYDTRDGGKWEYAGYMSLMSSGSWNSYNSVRGNGAAYMDPWNMIELGLYDYEVISEDGEYTLYNRQADQPYNIYKILTPDPNEYYLIENRYSDKELTQFDNIGESNLGIVIWHIDEGICKSVGNSVNSSGYGHDPGVAVMGSAGLAATSSGFKYVPDSPNGMSYTFNSGNSSYKFPISGTCYTRLKGDDAAAFQIIIKVQSELGSAMTIKVEGCANVGPTVIAETGEITESSTVLNGKILSMNGGDCTSCGFIVSKYADPTVDNGVLVECTLNPDGTFSATVEGLEANTKYFYKVYAEGSKGYSYKIYNYYTKTPKIVRNGYYVVYMYKGLTDTERSYEVKVKPGELLTYKFPMEKRGYVLAGWYRDAEFKERYDMSYTQEECEDFVLYAKWVKENQAATLKLVGATSKYLVFGAAVGDTFAEVVPNEKAGYTFMGWYTDPDFQYEYDFGTEIEQPGEYTLYAKWAKEGEETTVTTETETTEAVTTDEVTETETAKETETQKSEQTTNPATVILIVVAAVVVLCGVAIVVLRAVKKKK